MVTLRKGLSVRIEPRARRAHPSQTRPRALNPREAARAPPEPVYTRQPLAGVCPCPAQRHAQPRRARRAAPRRRSPTYARRTCAALGDASAYYVAQGYSSWSAAAAGTATDYCTFWNVGCISGLVTWWCVARRLICNGWHQHAVLLLLSTCLFCLYRNLYLRSGDTIPDSIGNITTLQYLCERTTVLFPFCLQTDY
jgi:hypothetical protein